MYKLVIEKSKLDIYKTLNSGQVFRYHIIDDGKYFVLMTGQSYVAVETIEEGYLFDCEHETFDSIWLPYLDLERDYDKVNLRIIRKDKRLKEAIKDHQGIRILKQDPFEMLITFIVSQSKAIPQIKKLVDGLSEEFGNLIGNYNNIDIYRFPRPSDLKHLKEADYRKMKFGYRASYLEAGVDMFCNSEEDLSLLSDEDLKSRLVSIKGVGDKVASCVMLFGYGRHSSFPIDVWMRRIVMALYFENEVKKVSDKKLEKFGKDMYGNDAGIAQQYLFEYGRTKIND